MATACFILAATPTARAERLHLRHEPWMKGHTHVGFVDQTPGTRFPVRYAMRAPPRTPSVPTPEPTQVSGCLSAEQVASYARAAGFPESVIPTMIAIGYRESHLCPGAVNSSSGACGLFQIYPAQPGCLDAMTNVRMAYAKYRAAGLSPWGG